MELRRSSVDELAQFLECDLEAVIDGLAAAAAHEALLLQAAPFAPGPFEDPPSDQAETGEHQLAQFADPAKIFAYEQDLSRSERLVLYLRFQETRSQSDIAKRLGVSEVCVSRMIRDALPRLRARSGDCAVA
ncbi:MAG: sigma-70 family RNA polymerase sigma factor [Solirubrobacteraceae bacterium]